MYHYARMPGHNRFQHTCSFQLNLSLSDDPGSGWRRAGQIADLISPANLVMLQNQNQAYVSH